MYVIRRQACQYDIQYSCSGMRDTIVLHIVPLLKINFKMLNLIRLGTIFIHSFLKETLVIYQSKMQRTQLWCILESIITYSLNNILL